MNGEYKDIYTEETQRIINRRFRGLRPGAQGGQLSAPRGYALLSTYHIRDNDIDKPRPPPLRMTMRTGQAAEKQARAWGNSNGFRNLSGTTQHSSRGPTRMRQGGRQAAHATTPEMVWQAEQVKSLYPSFTT